MQDSQASPTPRPLELQSKFCSGEECFDDPHSVRIRVPAGFIDKAEKAMQFMQNHDFNTVTVAPVGEYTLFNDDGEEMEDRLLDGCHAEISKSGHVRFLFPFRHANDQGWTQQNWSIVELAQLAIDPQRLMPHHGRFTHH